MKKLCVVLFSLFLVFVNCSPILANQSYSNNDTNYKAVIQDNADLLTDVQEQSVLESMQDITAYENICFLTCNDNYYGAESNARSTGESLFGSTSAFTVFVIDMKDREIYIYSSKSMYNKLSKDKANIITDNVYSYASDGEYEECATQAFNQILSVLQGDKLSSPMKIVCCVLISITAGLTICEFIMALSTELNAASDNEIEEGMGKKRFVASNIHRRLIRTVFVPTPKSSGGHGGGGHGGGGGGGGGGHGF